jgi:hypothetical protein
LSPTATFIFLRQLRFPTFTSRVANEAEPRGKPLLLGGAMRDSGFLWAWLDLSQPFTVGANPG